MQSFLEGFVLGLIAITLLAIVGGTVVWILWPMAIPYAFPGLVASGVIAGKLSWWTSVTLTWIFGLLIKSTQTNNNSK